MNINAQIEEAERLYKNTLEDFLLRAMSGVNLESHGPDHHRRVWAFAKQVITSRRFINNGTDKDFVKKLLIASFLHDSGMVVDTGPRHGIHSRSFCEKYLSEIGDRTDVNIDLLEAIEHHDNKEYNTKSARSSLEEVLNIADDMDAFGYIGIYRYLEIYLERKITYKSVGEEIRNNAAGRYRNIELTLKSDPRLIGIHQIRYMILDSFFSQYNTEVQSYSFGTGNPSGYCGVAELIGESVRTKGIFKELLLKSSESKYGNTINQFFNFLGKEITNFHNGL